MVLTTALIAWTLVACGAPRMPEIPLTRIAFGSCSDQNLPQPIWRAVLDYRPEMFLFLGDNVYGDVSSSDMTELRNAYSKFAGNADVADLRTQTEVLATWDDHDYGRNDAGADFEWRRKSEEMFLDFWDVPPGDPRRGREGVYVAKLRGPPGRRIQIILLDTRSFRSPLKKSGLRRPRYLPDPDAGKTMLGPAQWSWLERQLRKPADLRLLVSSIQVLADGHGYERWENLPRERQRLYDLLKKTRANGVVLLSGDRHFGAVYRQPDAIAYPLHELTSSSLNRPWRDVKEQVPQQTGLPMGGENFGSVDIDWQTRRATLSLRNISGGTARRVTVSLDDLKP